MNITQQQQRLRYFNVTEWLYSSPGGTKFSKLIEEMPKEELNVRLTCFYISSRKKDGTYYISSSKSPHQSFPLLTAAQQTFNNDTKL